MQMAAAVADPRVTVSEALKAMCHDGFQSLSFQPELESRFEADTREARAYRMWREGLIAILVFNACLMLDYLMVKDPMWMGTLERTAYATPVAFAVNMLMRLNPVRWVREGSVAAAMVAICFINLAVQGNASTPAALFGIICLLITALFAGVVMRLRFAYTLASIGLMLPGGMWSLGQSKGLPVSERVIADSLMLIGLAIILVAAYSLEREERRSYLLCLQRDMKAEDLELCNMQLQHLSCVDKLTGLPNRRALEEKFELLWKECVADGQPLAAIIVDIDHFKFVNDIYGHLHGDEALRRLGTLLPKALRGPSDMVARFGGEEFVLLLPYAELGVALTVAERVRALVEAAGTPIAAIATGETTIWTTVSCGVSCCMPSEALKWTDLLASADFGLYAAKRAGRNRVEYRECEEPRPVAPLDAIDAERREVRALRRVVLGREKVA